MRRILLCIIVLFAGILSAVAQNEISADTITKLPPNIRNYDGFLLDMGLMNVSLPTLPKFTLEIPDASKDYSRAFRLNADAIYSQGLSNLFSLSNSHYFGLTGFGSPTDNLQMGSFRLKNGIRINTYGEYDKDGRKVYNPSALPWERNNFKGAFELKSANGAFGIRIEVQQGRKTPWP